MLRQMIVATAVAVAVFAAGVHADAGEWTAKKAKKTPDHMTFTYANGATSFSVIKKGKQKTPKVGTSIFGSDRFEISCDASTKTQINRFTLDISKIDLAHQTYPLTLSDSQAPYAVLDVESSIGGGLTLLGHWQRGTGSSVLVTYDSYNKKTHKLTGHFSATLADILLGHPNGNLVIPDGQFQITVPTKLTK
jgi:hypothetical protein